jgi:hypothetical protein
MPKMPIPEWLSALDSLFVRYWELEQLARRRDPDPLVLAGDRLTATQTYRVMEQLNRLLRRYRCGGYSGSEGYYVRLTPEGVETLPPINRTPELETAALNALLEWLKPAPNYPAYTTRKEQQELGILRRVLDRVIRDKEESPPANWSGDDWAALDPQTRRLLLYMHPRENADLCDLCPEVWGKDYADVSDAAIQTTTSKANNFLGMRESERRLKKVRKEPYLRWE